MRSIIPNHCSPTTRFSYACPLTLIFDNKFHNALIVLDEMLQPGSISELCSIRSIIIRMNIASAWLFFDQSVSWVAKFRKKVKKV
uniref:Uncharacterized protein n=1 Tax=Lactuca sativa TaxID=4236 RepID=A0A9R1VC25_LACSA|nr:hypothetical protein LSAT_V11C600313360 [Lactuca sativa]